MPRLLTALIALLAFTSGGLSAQTYPDYTSLFVNDLAGVIDAEAEARLAERLSSLREETGVEATVLTLSSRAPYAAGETLEDFATGLFNHWGIGLAERNDGILILVVTGEREMRVELGSGYSQDYDTIAQDIVTRVFLPPFRSGDYAAGIEAGTAELDDRIARRRAANLAPLPLEAKPEEAGGLVALAAAALVGLALFRRRLGDMVQRFRRCPSCGRTGLRRARQTIRPATTATPGLERVRTDCPACGWHSERDDRISRIRHRGGGSSGGSFGGGRSSGGGVSGRW
ncbi:TPM domain-containing protein [Albidovulum sediminis]|uniref:TPM domain-containing protein n=1 Tax=Albidovulum sediminis TaxID=3066345 RepID=A0ABT2NIE9_9RHOB|nr:TPM domain-containing protein [Defluviimonas sediminis]MCT8328698.1 TPM domain-containing protein [Defluviimonas sediminis]